MPPVLTFHFRILKLMPDCFSPLETRAFCWPKRKFEALTIVARNGIPKRSPWTQQAICFQPSARAPSRTELRLGPGNAKLPVWPEAVCCCRPGRSPAIRSIREHRCLSSFRNPPRPQASHIPRSISHGEAVPMDRLGVSHSRSFDHLFRPETLRTAMATAFFCPAITTSRLPRVRPV